MLQYRGTFSYIYRVRNLLQEGQDMAINRICWRLTELPEVTGLSLPYWRKMTAENKLPVRRIGRSVIILHEDLMRFLAGSDGVGVAETDAIEITSADDA